uniref:Uncharacterized protein n=1 Tax=Rhizophora mucronata TaxID=61149 RepID=A0A2P2NCM1_RHIMU
MRTSPLLTRSRARSPPMIAATRLWYSWKYVNCWNILIMATN